jgi:hypothetical protein
MSIIVNDAKNRAHCVTFSQRSASTALAYTDACPLHHFHSSPPIKVTPVNGGKSVEVEEWVAERVGRE